MKNLKKLVEENFYIANTCTSMPNGVKLTYPALNLTITKELSSVLEDNRKDAYELMFYILDKLGVEYEY